MPQANALFTADDLTDWLHTSVTAGEAEITESVVWGWLKPILQLDERPAQLSDELRAAAIELGGLVYTNPASLSDDMTGPFRKKFELGRREEILLQAANGGEPANVPAKPTGSFPPAHRYPDPARRITPATWWDA